VDENKNRVIVRINGEDKLINGATEEKETAAASEEKKEFPWVLPDENSPPKQAHPVKKRKKQKNYKSSVQTQWRQQRKKNASRLPLNRKRKSKNRPLSPAKKKVNLSGSSAAKKQWMTVLSAVFVGILMGLIVLVLFTENAGKEPTAGSGASAGGAHDATEVLQSNSNLDLSLAIIQGGAYSTTDKANEAASRLKEADLAAVLANGPEYTHMVIGTALDDSGANDLMNLYKEKGQDVYSEPWEVSIEEAMLETKETRIWLGGGKKLLETFIAVSAQGLTSDVPALTDKEWTDLQVNYEQWSKYAEENLVSLSKETQTSALAFMGQLEQAIGQLEKYRESPDKSGLWRVQQSALQAMLNYKDIAESLKS
jgi:stage II sporulation protein B